jgi:ABC-type transport system involved in multi-copper enzyme maturation permease subunit
VNLLRVEMQRALRRRAVRVLVSVALFGIALAAVVAFRTSAGRPLAELTAHGDAHPAIMRTWWRGGSDDGALSVGFMFLLVGALIGGATVAGGEWRTGTVATLLTWEPRRGRVFFARIGACAVLALLIAFGLEVLFLAAFTPAAVVNGSTAGVDAGWWVALVAALTRGALLASAGAVLAAALAMLARNTAFALVAVFAWAAVIEGAIRSLRPGWARYLVGENIAIALTWAQLETAPFTRAPMLAWVYLVLYLALVVGVAATSFARRDVGGAT